MHLLHCGRRVRTPASRDISPLFRIATPRTPQNSFVIADDAPMSLVTLARTNLFVIPRAAGDLLFAVVPTGDRFAPSTGLSSRGVAEGSAFSFAGVCVRSQAATALFRDRVGCSDRGRQLRPNSPQSSPTLWDERA